MNILILDNIGSFSLVPYLRESLLEHKIFSMANIATNQMWEILESTDPDVVFIDFCNENAIDFTNRVNLLKKKPKIIIRLHRYEAHSLFIKRVNWDTVSTLITVSQKYKDIVSEKIPSIRNKIHVVYNGIDLEKFQLQKEIDMNPNAIAYAGYLNKKKGIPLLRTVMASTPNKHYYIAGSFQEEEVQQYMDDLKLDNVTYCGWSKTEEFLKGKRYVISTSLTESFGMSIAEGMAMGLTPLVHAWPGADLLWPKECIWKTFDELKWITPKDPEWCRQWIVDRYSIDECVKKISNLLLS